MEQRHIAAGWIDNAEHHVKPTSPQSPIKVQLINEMVEIKGGKIVAVTGSIRLTPYHAEQAPVVIEFTGGKDLSFRIGVDDASSKPEATADDGNSGAQPSEPVQQEQGGAQDVPPTTTRVRGNKKKEVSGAQGTQRPQQVDK